MKRVKYIFGLIGISFILLSFSQCGSSKPINTDFKFVETPPFVISKIVSQKWVAGIQGGGSGTNLIINFSKLSEGISFEEIYFRGKKVKATSKKENQIIGYFTSETNREVIMDSDALKEAANIPPEKIPFQLDENEAVIRYIMQKKIYYYKIENIEEKPILSYPQVNPNIKN